jgi:hypothetical protein
MYFIENDCHTILAEIGYNSLVFMVDLCSVKIRSSSASAYEEESSLQPWFFLGVA